jgi:chromosome condensin MukBEF MukE localization factor
MAHRIFKMIIFNKFLKWKREKHNCKNYYKPMIKLLKSINKVHTGKELHANEENKIHRTMFRNLMEVKKVYDIVGKNEHKFEMANSFMYHSVKKENKDNSRKNLNIIIEDMHKMYLLKALFR